MSNTRARTTGLPGKSLLPVLLALALTPSAPGAWAQGGRDPASPARQESTEAELESGKTVEREIKGGEAHAYRVTLRRGEFLHAVATPQGVDVVATLYGPGGEKLLASDLLKYPGPEPVSFVAEREGAYRLEVGAAGAEAVGGRYVLRSETRAAATEADKERLAAEGVLREAAALEREGSKESLERSVERYGEGARRWRGAGNKFWEAVALHYSGRASWSLGEREKALELYNQALNLRKIIGDRAGEAATLNNIGNVYSDLGEKRKALEFYNLSLPLRRAAGDGAGEAATLHNIGIIYSNLGEKQKALEFYSQALPLRRAAGDRAGEAATLTGIGGVYSDLGEQRKALEFHNLSLAIRRAAGNRAGEAITLNNIGTVYSNLGERRKALEFYSQSLPLSRAVGDRMGEARTLNNVGSVYSDLGEKQKALEFYNLSLAIRRAVGDRAGEANTLIGIGTVYSDLGEKQKALEFYNQSLPLKRAVGDRAGEAITLADLMLLHSGLDNSPLAILYGKQAVNTYQQLRGFIQGLDKGIQKTYLQTVEVYYRRLADLLLSQGRLPEAEQVLSLLKEEEYSGLLRRRSDPTSDIGYSSAEAVAVKILAQLADLGRERGELAALADKKALDEAGKQRLNQIEREFLPKANAEYNRALESVSREAPDTALKTAEVRDAQALAGKLRKLGPGTVALYTIVSAEKGRSTRGWVMLITPDFRRAYEFDVSGLDQTVLAFRNALLSPADPRPHAHKLYRALFQTPQPKGGPTLAQDLEKYLRDQPERTLMWSLDGVLRYVPVAALSPDGEHYLVERYRNVVFTPASIPTLTDPVSRDWKVLGLGVSKEYKPFAALAGVPRELAAIVRADGGQGTGGVLSGAMKLDEQFNAEAMMDGLREGYAVVHIASHFHYDPADPNRSFLLLGDGGHLEMATFNDAPQVFEKTELLTLSACETAMGSDRDANGKDAEGLGYVAQKLGAQSVIATLWPVDDIGTQVLMPEFYRLRESSPGMAKAEALRQAQLALLTGKVKPAGVPEQRRGLGLSLGADKAPYAHPYYWAPFILIGNWK